MAHPVLPKTASLTQARLKEVLTYEPSTGRFFRRSRPGVPVGWKMGDGYLCVRIDGVAHLLHRLAWLYMTGALPPNQIDHRNRKRADNRWINLRCATNAENHQNRKRRSDNRSGSTGVDWDEKSGKWRARIGLRGQRFNLGFFDALDDAAFAYAVAKAEKHQFQPTVRAE